MHIEGSNEALAPEAWPIGTYRLQLSPSFTFADVTSVARYLASLGVSDVYLSPILEAVTGSTHGYDVVDHGRIREALGAQVRDGRRAEFAAFGWDPSSIPDPPAPDTFARSRLDWAETDAPSTARCSSGTSRSSTNAVARRSAAGSCGAASRRTRGHRGSRST